MKLVFYSNVIIAAFATQGVCHSLLEHCLYSHTIFFSEDLLNEISRKLQIRMKIPKQLAREIVYFLKSYARTLLPQPIEQRSCKDPKVDHVINLAMAARSDYVISGDSNLLALKQYRSIYILSPRDFWNILQKQGKKALVNKI